jgi:hypothetical protein
MNNGEERRGVLGVGKVRICSEGVKSFAVSVVRGSGVSGTVMEVTERKSRGLDSCRDTVAGFFLGYRFLIP